jgi:hypothetical protein
VQVTSPLVCGLQEAVGTHVVDGVMEDIRLGMEVNLPKYSQRRVAMIKYLGELYNYRMVESSDIFKVIIDCFLRCLVLINSMECVSTVNILSILANVKLHLILTLWHQKSAIVDVQCYDEKPECPQQLSVKNMQSNGWRLKSRVFCRVRWELDSSCKGLMRFQVCFMYYYLQKQT